MNLCLSFIVYIPSLFAFQFSNCINLFHDFCYISFSFSRYAVSSINVPLALSIIQHKGMDKSWLTEAVDYGYTPLHFACENGSDELTEALCQSLLQIESKELDSAMRAKTEDMHLQKAIVQTGGKTPLHLAAIKVSV